jgi:hypothetical protein
LGEQSFAETEGAFRALLNSVNTATELRVAALEALAQTKGDPTILLMEQFDDPDPAPLSQYPFAMRRCRQGISKRQHRPRDR